MLSTRAAARAAVALSLLLLTAACGESSEPSSSLITAPPSPTTVPAQTASGPVKGLADNPAFQWWRWSGGAQPDSWWGADQNPETLRVQTDLMRRLGVRLFRVELVWSFVEPTMPGGNTYDSTVARNPDWTGYQWSRWDMIVSAATAAGIDLVPEVYYTPTWAGGVPLSVNGGPNAAPRSAAYYGDFVSALVKRYHDRIHYWEMWNEPDYGPRAWNGTLSQYVTLILKPGYQAAKQADPACRVLLGGVASDTHLEAFYKAGARPYFDIVSFHAYYAAGAGDSTALDHIRSAMTANYDDGKPVWLTEFGMPTSDPQLADSGSQSETALAAQARLIHDVYAGLRAQAIFFYELHDTAVYGPNGPIKYVYWGLVSRDFSRTKPSLDAYMNAPSPSFSAAA